MEAPKLGQLVPDDIHDRDAIHVAVIPARAVCVLQPGQHLQTGIVDPYLTESVQPGQRFWLCLYPGTVTSLRHSWTHPAYPDSVPITDPPVPHRRSEATVWAEQAEREYREQLRLFLSPPAPEDSL
jgi:hypothetical protein